MKQNIKLNDNFTMDLPVLLETHLLIQANSGGGKSWLLRRILEQSHGHVQQIIIDPEGEFGSLREKFDYILAGKEGDTPADPRSAGLLAHKLLELGVSAIIDLYELHPQERKHFVRLFLEAMVNSPKSLHHPCLVVIDEAHTFAPEKGQSEALDAVIGLASLGRKRGFCAILATQRIAKLHKDAAAECNNKLIGRTGLDIDRKRAAEELGFTSKEEILTLRTLAPGEFYAFGPAISDEVIKEKVGSVETTHPRAGSKLSMKIAPPTSKIKALLPQLADLPSEAKKEAVTNSELKAQVRNLEIENSKLKRNSGPTKIEKIEVPVIGKRTLIGLQKARSAMWKILAEIKGRQEMIEDVFHKFEKEMIKIEYPQDRILRNGFTGPFKDISVYKPGKPLFAVQESIKERDKINSKYSVGVDIGNGKDKTVRVVAEHKQDGTTEIQEVAELSNPEQRILNAIAWLHSVRISEPEQTAVAFLAGYKVGGGAFNNPRGSLRVKGLVEYRGSKIVLTPQGFMLAHTPEEALTTEELHRKVLAILPGPEKKIMEILFSIYPEEITNEELAERAGYAAGGGAFNNPRGRLRTLGLIEYTSGRIKVKDYLFL